MIHKILLLGPQGCGKGTQAKRLGEKLGIPVLGMGQLLRDEAEHDSELGKEIDDIIHKRGDLVPDGIAMRVLQKRLAQADTKNGYILDGYPRNLAQYEAFERVEQPTAAIIIEIPRDESIRRVMKRAESEARKDDTHKMTQHRLDIYERETKPVIERYRMRGIVREIDGMFQIEEVAARIAQALGV